MKLPHSLARPHEAVGAASLALGALVASACSATGDPSPTRSKETLIVGGTPSSDAHVVALVRRRVLCEDDAPPEVLCTGTLVAPRIVLTAAHCLGTFDAERLEIAFGSVVESAGIFVTTDRAVRHPQYDPATHAHDIGLVRLVDDAPAEPLPLTPPPSLTVGEFVRAVGFGRAEPELESGARRSATMTIDLVSDLTFRAVSAPGMSCAGDSGGPVFVSSPAGDALVGLTASGDAACAKYAIQTRLDVDLDGFVLPTVAALSTPASAPSVPAESLCSAACVTDSDCPYALPCLDGRCLLPGATDAELGEACTASDGCGVGETCRRVRSSGADACRCARPCGGAPPEQPTAPPAPVRSERWVTPEGGCSSAPRRGGSLTLFVLSSLALVVGRRRPRRALRGGRPS